MRYLFLDKLSRSYNHFSRLLRVFRGVVAYGTMSLVVIMLFPLLNYIYLPGVISFYEFIAGFFLEVNHDSFLFSDANQEILTSILSSKKIIAFWLLFLLPLVVFFFYLYIFVYQKIAQFSRFTALTILLLIIISWLLWPLSLKEGYEYVQEPIIFWIFVVAGGLIYLSVGWIILCGLLVILRYGGTVVQSLFTLKNPSTSFFLKPRQLVEELYKAMGIIFAPADSGTNAKILAACLCAIVCEGLAYSTYLRSGGKLVGDSIFYSSGELAKQFGISGSISDFLSFVAFLLIFSFISAYLFFWISRRLRYFAMRRSIVLANEACQRDLRPPVLFLRTFCDDQVSLKEVKSSSLVRFFDPGIDIGTLDELVVKNLTHYGPVIGLGNPKDDLPPIGGAFREYTRTENWQKVVETFMQKSVFIVVAVDFSQNLQWEIETIKNRKWLHKTIFLLPPHLSLNINAHNEIFKLLGIKDGNDKNYQVISKSSTEKTKRDQFNRLEFPNRYLISIVWQNDNCPVAITSDRSTELEYELSLRISINLENILITNTCQVTNKFTQSQKGEQMK